MKDEDDIASFASEYHIPVLLNEVIEHLEIKPSGVYVDCTFGGGGHSRAILQKLGEKGRLLAFDQDADAQQNLPDDTRVVFVPQNFRHLQRFLRLNGITEVDGVLADLGVSSYQFDEASRGFSIRFDGALDMRMDQRQEKTAADVLNKYSEAELHKLFEQYGEVTNSKTLARTIIDKRRQAPFQTIEAFKDTL
ncbi:MAG TPA: 16S rRNA (cytosine(1402)-N(4))-methyltransferase RsmH, partial [Flavisolibacter sp.]|nr:16S rRNA (cytosine(1402)-N(4))-methyltransferase RsmH [Flavisolibacter sp.]